MRWVLDIIGRWPWIALPALLTCLGVLAFAGVAAGLIPITASSGHWPITEWFLHFAMRRSVVTHARLVPQPPPDLDSAAMVLRGAGHYENGCRPCHGAPGDRLPIVPHAMTPHPPELGPRVPTWNERELFYIVKHGVKFTGMPAWPVQRRDDEVWAMVGFLRKIPELSADDYAQLVRGEDTRLTEMMAGGASTVPPPPDLVVEVCARCHGVDANGRGTGAFPKLAGQRFEYMMRAMHAYADGRRVSGIMQPFTSNVPEEARHRALEYYASLPRMTPTENADAAAVARGAVIARDGVPAQEVPACATCHSSERVNEAYPRLVGQHREYLVQQLKIFQQGRRGGSEFAHIMTSFVGRLTEQQIQDVAAFFAAGTP